MPIRPLDEKAAVARLSSIRFCCSVAEAAQLLAEWQSRTGGFIVPIAIELSRLPRIESSEGAYGAAYFRERAKLVRRTIAAELGLDSDAAGKLTFTMDARNAWYLGPRPKLDRMSMMAAVKSAPAKFIELMLQRELIEAAAFDAEHTFVTSGFGPGVFLGSAGQLMERRVHLAEAKFTVNAKHGLLLCDATSKVFAKKTKPVGGDRVSSATLPLDAGEGYMVNVTRLVPDEFFELDARRYPMVGVSLDKVKIRQSRLYYLNVLAEFAWSLFAKAGVPVERETFVASHCVDDGYIPLDPIARLLHPLEVVDATGRQLDEEALKPLSRFPEFFPDGYHVAGNKKAHFDAPVVRGSEGIPEQLQERVNYLFLNGEGDDEGGTVRVAKIGLPHEWKSERASVAYSGLARGEVIADPYTQRKFKHLMECDTVRVSMQGLDDSPASLASLCPGRQNPKDRPLQEALKRCLVELSLKESLLGYKPVPTTAMPAELKPASLTLLATRQIRMPGRQPSKQLVSAVDVTLTDRGISVERVRRSPWSSAELAAIDFVSEFPFLQPEGTEKIRDGQFWVVDRQSSERLTVWAGAFVPRIILNDQYEGIEAGLAAQDGFLAARRLEGSGKYYSKGREFNLLPYYMSMYRVGEAVRGEKTGSRIAVQDRGEFVRVFVPPEGGISGAGDSLSGMRDVMLYASDGKQVSAGLLDHSLVQLYLHTMTNGILVGGDNSKMSVLEKLARLALEG